jgi:hypothetical protein
VQTCTEAPQRRLAKLHLLPLGLLTSNGEAVEPAVDFIGFSHQAAKKPDGSVSHACHAAVRHRGRRAHKRAVVRPLVGQF